MRNPPSDQLPPTNAAPPVSLRPTRTRYWVIVFAVTLAIIQYIDRVCISQAAPFISRDLRLDDAQMGWVFSAFTLAYALFEIPAGYLGDRIGPRKVLIRIVLWWSFFTAATGWMRNWVSLAVTRFLFGAGEAGAFPNLTKAFHRWLPSSERTRAQGIMWTSARLGGAFTPLLVFALPSAGDLAHGLPALWPAGRRLGRRVLLVVPRRPARPPASQRSRGGAVASRARIRRTLPGTVASVVYLAHRLVPVRPVFRVQLLLLFLHHLVSDLPAQGPRLRR